MLCRSLNCGAEGLFHETEGFCRRCYDEVYLEEDSLFSSHYERKIVKPEKKLSFLAWLTIVCFIGFVGRAVWLMLVK